MTITIFRGRSGFFTGYSDDAVKNGMKKISIIGSGGAGKSTLARKLEAKIGIPVYHLDALYWKPGWVKTEREAWCGLQEEICRKDTWILDGNYGATLDIRLKHSDTIIFIDINRYLCLARVLWRSFKSYRKTRPDMPVGCLEQFDLQFFRWILDYPKTKRPEILRRLEALSAEKTIVILTSPKAVKQFLHNLSV